MLLFTKLLLVAVTLIKLKKGKIETVLVVEILPKKVEMSMAFQKNARFMALLVGAF